MAPQRKIYVNIPVKDLKAAVAFFTELGFEFDPRFTNDAAAAMVVGDGNAVMLLDEEFFRTFTRKPVADAFSTTEAIISISAGSRQAVDEMVRKAFRAGGKESLEPLEMPGMYGWSFQDLDGHLWEVLFMDKTAIPNARPQGEGPVLPGES
jgi:predicted lactoylglutathione lyase